ncbi:MAG: tetratricopeptide repeat protein [Woeseiaceae bacterium]|nr:tetratricopeptide repeat protein [Woeseiaceae bacterium]
MTAAKSLGRALALALILAMPAVASAQDTMQVAASAEVRTLLTQAESLIAAGDANAAHALLAPRENELAGHAYFDYLLGVAALDSGRTGEAILSLQRSVSGAPQFAGARMELARAYFDDGRPLDARPLFAALLNENPPPGVRDIIDRYIAAIDAGPATPPADTQLYAELFMGYDDNANGSTDDQQFLGFTLNPENLETDSSFFEAAAGVDWTNPTSSTIAWHLGARAGYRKNPDASFVDSGVLSGLAGLSWRSGSIFGRAALTAYAATRDGESNESYTGLDLLVGRHINERWDVSLGIRSGALRYDDAIEILDVNRSLYTLGFAYRFNPRARFRLEAIGGSDDEQQSGSPYGNSKSGGRLSVNAPLGRMSYLFASIGSLKSDYDGLFFGIPREDTQTTGMLQIEFRDVITNGLTIAPRIRYIDNDSDVALYDYDRTEIGLLIRWLP